MSLRLVQVSAFPILPATAGGKIRIVKLARALSRLGVEVTIVAPFHVTQRRALANREPFRLCEVPYPFVVPFLLTDRPFPYGALVSFHPGFRALLPVSLASFDVCQIEHPAFVDLIRGLPTSLPLVYGSQNVELDYVSAESPPGAVRRMAGARIRKLEAQLVARADHVFACSEHDRSRFRELYGAREDQTSVLPNGLDLAGDDARRADRARSPASTALPRFRRRAIFTGSAVPHNHDAVRALLTHIAPGLETEVEFVIAGGCAKRFRGERRPNVVFDPDGELADYAGADVVGLNPVLRGSGTSLKLLHYLAHDLPVLSTPFGLRGFEELMPWVMTADLAGFSDALRGEILVPDGVRDALARYEWDRIARDALQVYRSLTDRA